MAAAGPSSACTSSACACSAFVSNRYRPALCLVCFHDIAAHHVGVWAREEDAAGRVAFRRVGTEERLFARPADLALSSAAAHGRELAAGGGGGSQRTFF